MIAETEAAIAVSVMNGPELKCFATGWIRCHNSAFVTTLMSFRV